MLHQTLARLIAEFGSPTTMNQKVCRWEVRPDAGIALECPPEIREKAVAMVWAPFPTDGRAIPSNALQYGPDEGRHSNTHALPGLRKGMPALKFFVRTADDLNALVDFIRALPPIRGTA